MVSCKRLTSSANSGIGSGNLYSAAALHICFLNDKDDEGEERYLILVGLNLHDKLNETLTLETEEEEEGRKEEDDSSFEGVTDRSGATLLQLISFLLLSKTSPKS